MNQIQKIMKKNLLKLIGFICIVLVCFSFSSDKPVNTEQIKYVYVCGNSKIYHKSKKHSAFRKCKAKIIKMTLINAKKMKKKECKCKDK